MKLEIGITTSSEVGLKLFGEKNQKQKLFWHCSFKLTVYFSVPADPILIYDEEGRERITFVGPYTENQDTKITCKAYGGTACF